MKPKSTLRHLLAILGTATLAISSASAQSGTWLPTTAGPFDWSNAETANWSGGTVASGADNTANFTSNITVNQVVNLAEARTIGNIVFNDASHDLTISGSNILTLATTSPDIPTISVTGGAARLLTIATEIAGDDGLRKDGIGRLSLTGTNTYTGGTFINRGEIRITSDANLGDADGDIRFTGNGILAMANGTSLGAGRTITVDSGFIGSLQSPNGANANHVVSVAGQLTGDGGFSVRAGYQLGSLTLNSTNTNNDFKGTLIIGRSSDFDVLVSVATLNIASLADVAGYGNIIFGRGNNNVNNLMTFNYSNDAVADLVLDNRRIELDGAVETAVLSNSSTTYGIIVNTDLLVSRAGNKALRLSAVSGSDNNVFAGDIANGTSAAIAIEKGGSGTWALSGTNTYSGRTTLLQANPVAGGITFQGMQSLSENTNLYQRHGGGAGGHGTWKFLDDSATPESRSTVDILHVQRNASQNSLSIFVGNNSTANGGTSLSTQTGSTIQLGSVTFQQETTGASGGSRLNLTGANDYGLQIANVNVNLEAAYTGTWNVRLDPQSAPLTVAGNIQQAAGSSGFTNLQLDGSVAGNLISGNVLDSADGTPQALSVNKLGTSTWTLTGANTYSGATTISSGTLEIAGSGTLGHVSAGVGNYAGAIAIASTNSGKLVYNSSASQTLGGVISGAGALDVEAGILTLTNDNTYTGATNVNGGTLVVNGDQSLATGAVTIASGATLGGSGTLGGAVTVDGSIAPGNSIGTLNVANNVTWNAGNAWQFELGAGNDSDVLAITGDFDKGTGSSFVFDFLNSTDLGTFTLVTWTGTTDFLLSDFSHINYDGAMAGSFVLNANSLQFTAIPEPSTALAGLLLGLGLLRRRRA